MIVSCSNTGSTTYLPRGRSDQVGSHARILHASATVKKSRRSESRAADRAGGCSIQPRNCSPMKGPTLCSSSRLRGPASRSEASSGHRNAARAARLNTFCQNPVSDSARVASRSARSPVRNLGHYVAVSQSRASFNDEHFPGDPGDLRFDAVADLTFNFVAVAARMKSSFDE